jgi:hypothetical protein
VSAALKSDQIEPFRQGFVGYANVDGRQWRVLVRLRLEDEAWWRGRLWFCEAGGTEVWDKEELLGRSPEEVLRQARALPTAELVRRFQESYDERRRYFALRALVDDFVEAARGLNRVAVRAGVDGAYGLGATRELDRLQRQMQFLVAGMRQVAGKEGRATP